MFTKIFLYGSIGQTKHQHLRWSVSCHDKRWSSNNTAQMQVNKDMKITISLCFCFIALIVLATITNELRLAERRAAMNSCKTTPYQCMVPVAGFASLH